MSADPYRLPYRPPILEDLYSGAARALEAIPLRSVLRVARAAPTYASEGVRRDATGRWRSRHALMYLPAPGRLTPDHFTVRAIGEEEAAALCAKVGGTHTSMPCAAMKPAARIRRIFDMLDTGAGQADIARALGVGEKYVENLDETLKMWRSGIPPEVIRSGGGCSAPLLALALAHDLNRPGGVPAGLGILPPPRLPPLESLPGDLPAMVDAIGMRDSLCLTHVHEALGRRPAAQLAEALGVGRLKPLPLRSLADALRIRHALDLLQLGWAAEDVETFESLKGLRVAAWSRGAEAWQRGADIEQAAAQARVRPCRLALALWREW